MKPYQVHLVSDESKIPDFLPSEPYFIYENKKYLNFVVYDCFHLRNNEYLKDIAKAEIDRIKSLEGKESPVKIFRKYRNMSQKRLAQKIGVDETMISHIERGKKQGSSQTLINIAKTLDVDLGDIV